MPNLIEVLDTDGNSVVSVPASIIFCAYTQLASMWELHIPVHKCKWATLLMGSLGGGQPIQGNTIIVYMAVDGQAL